MRKQIIRKTAAVVKHEMTLYFVTPFGYIFIAFFALVTNLMFYLFNILEGSSDFESLFSSILVVLMILTPLLTMRLFAEEVKQKTDQILITAPVSVWSIVLGKFYAAMIIFIMSLLVISIWTLILHMFGNPNYIGIFGNLIALLFSGSAFISIGLFISTKTSSQGTAAIASFASFLSIFLIDTAANNIDMGFISKFIRWVSLFSRYNNFAIGVFALKDIVFYISITVLFLVLSANSLFVNYRGQQ